MSDKSFNNTLQKLIRTFFPESHHHQYEKWDTALYYGVPVPCHISANYCLICMERKANG